jgi:hypothetical protein
VLIIYADLSKCTMTERIVRVSRVNDTTWIAYDLLRAAPRAFAARCITWYTILPPDRVRVELDRLETRYCMSRIFPFHEVGTERSKPPRMQHGVCRGAVTSTGGEGNEQVGDAR